MEEKKEESILLFGEAHLISTQMEIFVTVSISYLLGKL